MADGVTVDDIKSSVIELITKVFDVVSFVFKVIKMFK